MISSNSPNILSESFKPFLHKILEKITKITNLTGIRFEIIRIIKINENNKSKSCNTKIIPKEIIKNHAFFKSGSLKLLLFI